MIKKILIISLFALLVTAHSINSYAQGISGTSRDIDWKKITTRHFNIIFPEHLVKYGKKLAVITEKNYDILTRDQKWRLSGKTNVILSDSVDFSNGYSTPLHIVGTSTIVSSRTIVMYLVSPQPEESIGNFDNWLEILFIHEFTHTVNIDTMTGFPIFLNYLTGNFYYPNMMNPKWIIEGNAVFNETKFTETGRLRSSYVDMVMRTEVLTGNFKSISQASTPPRCWPKGDVPYLYGANFIKYLNETYADEDVEFSSLFHINGGRVFPFQNYRNAKKLYNASFDVLWEDWHESLVEKYEADEQIISQKGLTTFRNITNSGYHTSYPRFFSNDTVYFILDTDKERQSVSSYNISKKTITTETNIHNADSFALDEKGTIYANEMNVYSNTYMYKDIYEKGDFFDDQLTCKQRVLYFDYLNGKFAFISTNAGTYYLNLALRDNPENKTILIESDKQLIYCRFSPDGSKIAFSYRTNSGKGDTKIAYYDLQTKSIASLDTGRSINIFPFWNKDGSSLFYSSDATGVYNLYRADLAGKKNYQLTNTLTGVFSGDISPDNSKLALTTYSENGFDISLMDYPAKIIAERPFSVTMLDSEYFKDRTVIPYEKVTNYNSFLNFGLKNWFFLPFISVLTDNNNKVIKNDYLLIASITASDLLLKHIFTLDTYNYFGQKKTSLQTAFIETSFYPDIMLVYTDTRLFWGKDSFPWNGDTDVSVTRKTERSFTPSLIFPFYDISYLAAFQLFYSIRKEYTDMSFNKSITRERSQLANAGVMLLFDNTKLYGQSVAPENGILLTLFEDEYKKKIGSDREMRDAYATLTAQLPSAFDNHVLSLGARGGYSNASSDDYPFSLGSYKKGSFKTFPLGLRGYPGDQFYGTRMAVATLEYIFPIIEIDDSWSTIPLYLRKFWMKGFAEYGDVWTTARSMKRSAGAEVYMTFAAAYYLDLELFCGYARGFDKHGEQQIYFGLKGFVEYTKPIEQRYNFYR